MNDILVRGLSANTIETLQRRARYHQRSLEDEARALLESFASETGMNQEAAEERANAPGGRERMRISGAERR